MILAAPGTSFLAVKVPFVGDPPEGGRRGRIIGRSAASRRNFLKFMSRMRRDSLPVELTLTYPGEFDPSWKTWKEDLRRLTIRAAREWPLLGGVWVLEKQERGAPHFHCLLYGLASYQREGEGLTARPGEVCKRVMREFRAWVSVAWAEVVGSGDERHVAAGTRVAKVRSRAGVMSYMSGYLSKEGQTWIGEGVGRYWGKFHAEGLPLVEAVDVRELPGPNGVDVRTLRKFRESRRREQWRTHRARGSKGRKPGRQRAGSFWISCDVDAWLARGREMLEGRAWFKDQRHRAGERMGWPRPAGWSGVRKRQFPRPCGLSIPNHPAASALERLATSTLLTSATSRVGRCEHREPDASGGTPLAACDTPLARTLDGVLLLEAEAVERHRRALDARKAEKGAMRERWAEYDAAELSNVGLEISGGTYSPRGARAEACETV